VHRTSITRTRIVGFALAVLLVAVGRLGIHYTAEVEDRFPVTVVLGEAGSGLMVGSDVKVRGVLVGEVTALHYRDGQAIADVRIDSEPPLPRDVEVVVTAKTLLGPKQIELRPDGSLRPPYLEAGDVISAAPGHSPTEVQAVIHELERLFADIPEDRLAVLIEAMGSFRREDGELFARNIEQGEVLASFGARTAEAQIDRIAAFADVVEALAPRADDWNRLSRSLPAWVSLLPDRQADVAASLDALSDFSVGLAELLEIEEQTIHRLFVLGDRIGAVIEPRVHEIGNLIHGVYRYSRMFGQHGGSLSDGTEHAWFRAHIGEEGEIERFCESMPDELRDAAPGCVAPRGDD
jgi:virulence factor Mce-like protein